MMPAVIHAGKQDVMAIIYVAVSKATQEWGAEVGLGKNLYKVGVADGEAGLEPALAGLAGQSDWKVLKSEACELSEDEALAGVQRKEKMVDPAYYPRLRGTRGLFKVTVANVENSLLIALALEGKEPPRTFKVKPADVARYLISNALR